MKTTWLYQANWIRGCECLVDGGQMRYVAKPADTFIGYNTFDYFYPGGRGPTNQQSLYLDFANLSENPDDIATFLEKHGPLHMIGLIDPSRPTHTPDSIKGIVEACHTFRTCLSVGHAVE